MNVVTIIQARLGSTRFPRKVLHNIGGRPMLEQVYRRALKIKGTHQTVVAVSLSRDDDELAIYGHLHGIPIVRGGVHVNDVLSRYYDVATTLGADIIVRVTADCPCLDPKLSAFVLNQVESGVTDFASNRWRYPYPDGFDTEVFTYELLSEANKNATSAADREHVTPYMYRKDTGVPIPFYNLMLSSIKPSDIKVSVDTENDLERVRAIYRDCEVDFGLPSVLYWYEKGGK